MVAAQSRVKAARGDPMAPLPHVIWRPHAIFRNLYFQTVLADSGGLHATLGGYITGNHLKMAEIDSATCVCPKNHLEAVFDVAFGFWQPSI